MFPNLHNAMTTSPAPQARCARAATKGLISFGYLTEGNRPGLDRLLPEDPFV